MQKSRTTRLSDQVPGAEVRLAGGCSDTGQWLGEDLKGAEGLVLGLCSSHGKRHEIQGHLRKLGLEPGAVEAVDLGDCCARVHPEKEGTPKAALLLRAAAARAGAAVGSRPENVKILLAWAQQVSRRSLFTLPPVRYEIVPSIREELCAAEEGCRICAEHCPHDALKPTEEGRMALRKDPCTGCGACVSVCPRDALEFPGAALPQLEAQLGVLLDGAASSIGSRAILFHCHNSLPRLQALGREGSSYPGSWLPVEVPCLGMVAPAWILQCLSRGAHAVGLLSCPREECRFGKGKAMENAAGYCKAFLKETGMPEEAVRLFRPEDPEALARSLVSPAVHEEGPDKKLPETGKVRLSPRGAGEAAMALARGSGTPSKVLFPTLIRRWGWSRSKKAVPCAAHAQTHVRRGPSPWSRMKVSPSSSTLGSA